MSAAESRVARAILLAGAMLGVLLGGVMMYIAWRHNPQGAFHEEDIVHWGSWLAIGLAWFLLPAVPAAAIAAFAWVTGRRVAG